MKHIAAYLLLLVGGNAAPTADDIKKVLSAGGVEADDEALTRLMTAVDGKSIEDIAELVTEGSKKLVNIGGGGAAAPAAGGAAAAVVEEEEEEEEEEEDVGGAGDLFGGDDEDDW